MSYDLSTEIEEPQTRLWPLTFEPILERVYQKQTIDYNHKQVAVTWIIGIVLYDLFIISDFFAAPEYIVAFLVSRFLIATPACLLIIYLIWRKSKYYDLMTVGCSIVMTFVLSVLIIMTEGHFRSDYLFGNILLMLCGSAIGKPRTMIYCPIIILQFTAYMFTLQRVSDISGSTKIVSTLFSLSGAVVAFLVAYGLEQFSRRSFLLRLSVGRLNSELEQQSLTDPLTQLANRRAFERATTRYWKDASAQLQPVSLILIDIDNFKLFNDTYGHSAGDQCLERVAHRVRSVMPLGLSLAVRFGGEEMILFLPNTDFAQAHVLAEKVRLSVLQEAIPHSANTCHGVVSASLGVATTTTAECDVAELVVQADSALYAAKASGRNRVWPLLGSERGLSQMPE